MVKGRARTWVLSRHHIGLHLDLRRPRFQICENECLLFDPSSPCTMFLELGQVKVIFFLCLNWIYQNLLHTQCSSHHVPSLTPITQFPIAHPLPSSDPQCFFPRVKGLSWFVFFCSITQLSFTPSFMVSFNISYIPHMNETISLPFCDYFLST